MWKEVALKLYDCMQQQQQQQQHFLPLSTFKELSETKTHLQIHPSIHPSIHPPKRTHTREHTKTGLLTSATVARPSRAGGRRGSSLERLGETTVTEWTSSDSLASETWIRGTWVILEGDCSSTNRLSTSRLVPGRVCTVK